MNAFRGVDPNDPTHVQFETLPVKSVYQNRSWNDIIQTAEAEPMLEELRSFSASSKTATTTLPRTSTVKVRVLNASGRKGLAATALVDLQNEGFAPAGSGNASSRSTTEIRYAVKSKAKAQLTAKYIGGTLIEDSSVSDADVVVMLGNDFTAVHSATGSPSITATSGSSTTTTVPSADTATNGVVDNAKGCPA